MSRGRGAHYVPRVKDRDKREVAFSLVPSNLGKKGKVCSYSARLTHNQVLDEDSVISEMCEEFNLPKNRVVQNLQQISDYLVSRIKKGYQVTFGGFTVGLSISGKFDAMNAEFDPEPIEFEVDFSLDFDGDGGEHEPDSFGADGLRECVDEDGDGEPPW